jgi:hypothetical protein
MTSRSTNEELQTINDELGIRTAELNQLNGVGVRQDEVQGQQAARD